MNNSDIFDIITNKSPNLKWVPDRTTLLTRAGSHAYGTNIESSDEDFRGVLILPKEYYFGFANKLEQIELKSPDPDVVIYEMRKYFNLLINCNPGAMELLFVDSGDILICNDLGQSLIDNRELFLSKKARHTFVGYAISQLKRIQLHRRYLLNPPKAPPTRSELGLPEQTLIPQDQLLAAQAAVEKDLCKFNFDFMDDLNEATKIGIKNIMSEMLAEAKITTEDKWLSSARKIGLDDNIIEVMKLERSYNSLKTEWNHYQEWKKNRNPVRAAMEAKFQIDLKHASHLVRLLDMGEEVLRTGKLIVKRPDREKLKAIRNGSMTYQEIIDYADNKVKIIDELYKTSKVLPDVPDRNKLDALCASLIEKSFEKEI